MTLESGETLRADVVLGADGIDSVVRKAVLGEDAEDDKSAGMPALNFQKAATRE